MLRGVLTLSPVLALLGTASLAVTSFNSPGPSDSALISSPFRSKILRSDPQSVLSHDIAICSSAAFPTFSIINQAIASSDTSPKPVL